MIKEQYNNLHQSCPSCGEKVTISNYGPRKPLYDNYEKFVNDYPITCDNCSYTGIIHELVSELYSKVIKFCETYRYFYFPTEDEEYNKGKYSVISIQQDNDKVLVNFVLSILLDKICAMGKTIIINNENDLYKLQPHIEEKQKIIDII